MKAEAEPSEPQHGGVGEAQTSAAVENHEEVAQSENDTADESADEDAPKVEKEKIPLSSLHRTMHSGEAAAQIDRKESDMPWLRKAMGFKDWVPNSRI